MSWIKMDSAEKKMAPEDKEKTEGYRCTICFEYQGFKLHRHLHSVCMRGRDKPHCKTIADKMIQPQKETKTYSVVNAFFDPRRYANRPYSLHEVCEMFERHGHCVVPADIAATRHFPTHRVNYEAVEWRGTLGECKPPVRRSTSTAISTDSLLRLGASRRSLQGASTLPAPRSPGSLSLTASSGPSGEVRPAPAAKRTLALHPVFLGPNDKVEDPVIRKRPTSDTAIAPRLKSGRFGRIIFDDSSEEEDATLVGEVPEPRAMTANESTQLPEAAPTPLPKPSAPTATTATMTAPSSELLIATPYRPPERSEPEPTPTLIATPYRPSERSEPPTLIATPYRPPKRSAPTATVTAPIPEQPSPVSASTPAMDIREEPATQPTSTAPAPTSPRSPASVCDEPATSPRSPTPASASTAAKTIRDEAVALVGCRGAKLNLGEKGFYDIPDTFTEQTVFHEFDGWYDIQGKSANVKQNYLGNAMQMVFWMNDRRTKFDTRCLTKDNFLKFVNFFKLEGVNPKTCQNYAKTFKHLLTFLRTDSAYDLAAKDPTEHKRLKNLTTEIKNVMKGLEKSVSELNRATKATKTMPPNPSVITRVLDVAKKDFERLLVQARQGIEPLGKYDVSLVNCYIAAYICLFAGSRPSVMANMKVKEYEAALLHSPVVSEGNTYYLVNVAEHKTDLQFDARVVLDSYWKGVFACYNEHIREEIVARTRSHVSEFFVQHNGKPFARVPQGLNKLHKRYGLPVFTASDARKSIETYSQLQPKRLSDEVSRFLCHSTKVRDGHYSVLAARKDVEVINHLKKLNQHHRDPAVSANEILSVPTPQLTAPPVAETPFNTPPTRPTRPKRKKTKTPTPETTPESTTSPTSRESPAPRRRLPSPMPGTSRESPEPRKRRPQPRPRVVGVRKSTENRRTSSRATTTTAAAPLTYEDVKAKGRQYFDRAVSKAGGDVSVARYYSPTQIARFEADAGLRISSSDAESVARRQRYLRERSLAREIAMGLLVEEARKKKTDFSKLTVDDIPKTFDKVHHGSSLSLKADSIRQEMVNIVTAQDIQRHQTDDEALNAAIKTQNWPGLMRKRTAERGVGVFTKTRFERGQILLDFHGERITVKEANRRLQANPSANILIVGASNGGEFAVDASDKCGCHCPGLFLQTMGREVNHSKTENNVKPQLWVVAGKEVVLFLALRDIAKGEELLDSV